MRVPKEIDNIYAFIKIVYALTVCLLVLLWAVLTGPLYEVYIDISVNPPEIIRKTDFSWITVSEWFNSQSYIITSHSVLQKIHTPININKLKKIIVAKRLGGADIMRISVKSNDKPQKLENVVLEIASLYLAELNGSAEQGAPEEKIIQRKRVAAPIVDNLHNEKAKIKKEIDLSNERLESNQAELSAMMVKMPNLSAIENEISKFDSKLKPLKQKLADLRLVYADGWHEIADLKIEIKALEKERSALYVKLPIAKQAEDEKQELEKRIRDEKRAIMGYQNRFAEIEAHLNKAEEMQKTKTGREQSVTRNAGSEKDNVYGYIINPPTLNLLPELVLRVLIGGTFGVILWFLSGFFFKKR